MTLEQLKLKHLEAADAIHEYEAKAFQWITAQLLNSPDVKEKEAEAAEARTRAEFLISQVER